MMKIRAEDAETVRAKLAGTSTLEQLLVDAWCRLDKLTARVARLERTGDTAEGIAHPHLADKASEQTALLQRMARLQRDREKAASTG